MHNPQTLPTTDGQPLAVGAHLRYGRYYKLSSDEYEWRERTGIVTRIDQTEGSVRVALSSDTGRACTQLIQLADGRLQMCASNYLAEILAPASAPQPIDGQA